VPCVVSHGLVSPATRRRRSPRASRRTAPRPSCAARSPARADGGRTPAAEVRAGVAEERPDQHVDQDPLAVREVRAAARRARTRGRSSRSRAACPRSTPSRCRSRRARCEGRPARRQARRSTGARAKAGREHHPRERRSPTSASSGRAVELVQARQPSRAISRRARGSAQVDEDDRDHGRRERSSTRVELVMRRRPSCAAAGPGTSGSAQTAITIASGRASAAHVRAAARVQIRAGAAAGWRCPPAGISGLRSAAAGANSARLCRTPRA
jgi:hypothetical protein